MLSADRVEIVPVEGIVELVRAHVPPGTGVSVTALPAHGIERTVAVALDLARAGFDAIPHVAAARIADVAQLERVLDALDDSPVSTLFVVGGDDRRPGDAVRDGHELLERIRERSGRRFGLGAAAYPEGHPAFDLEEGLRVLARKAPLADYAVTQMCFDADVVSRFLERARETGLDLPTWVGIPGPVGMRQLLGLAARIGVGPSLAFARKGSNRRLLARYDDARLRSGIRQGVERSGTAIAGFHVYSFNRLGPRGGQAS